MYRVVANFYDGSQFKLGYQFATEWAAQIYARDCIENENVHDSYVWDTDTGEIISQYETSRAL